MRRLLIAIALIGALAVPASVGAASGPVITPVSRGVTTPIPFGANCGSFVVLFTVNAEGTNISFYDDQSQLVKQIRHVQFTGTLYNSSDLSKSVPYEGAFTRRFDTATNTATLTGLRFKVRLPGEGVVALDTGEEVFAGGTTLVSDTGNTFASFVSGVCAALGG
jgi:hypothetical protein